MRTLGPPPVTVLTSDDRAGEDSGAGEPVDLDRLGELATAVLVAEGVLGPAELTLTVVDEETMAGLNRRYLDEDGPTDVLAFPLDDGRTPRPAGQGVLLGDVVVCPAVAQRYAATHGRRFADELSLLVVHGVLHVLGHDHAEPDETAVMRERELHHLTTLVDPHFTLSP
jgi:probable rRNA maturation factor